MGPLYASYAKWLIQKHPANFVTYFIWPNIINYYVPDGEFMNVYNMGKDSVEDMAKVWFFYKSNKVHANTKNFGFVELYPPFLGIVNVLFLLCFICFGLLGGFASSSADFRKSIRWIGIIWLANFAFSVLASPVVLRYQLFPMTFTLVAMGLLFACIIQKSKIASRSLDQVKDKFKNNKHHVAVGLHQ